MNKTNFYGMLILLVVLIGLVACAKPPTAEIEAATTALARAENNADVREYAPDSLSRAKSLVDRMQAEVATKRYDSAKSLALEAVAAADKAIRDGASAKGKARTDTASSIASVKTVLEEIRQTLSAAEKVKGISLDLPAMERDINAVVQTLSAADADLTNNNFTGASEKAQNARSLLSGIQRRISDAVQKATRRK